MGDFTKAQLAARALFQVIDHRPAIPLGRKIEE